MVMVTKKGTAGTFRRYVLTLCFRDDELNVIKWRFMDCLNVVMPMVSAQGHLPVFAISSAKLPTIRLGGP